MAQRKRPLENIVKKREDTDGKPFPSMFCSCSFAFLDRVEKHNGEIGWLYCGLTPLEQIWSCHGGQ